MKFRKRPVVVEAMEFDGSRESALAICEWGDGCFARLDSPVELFVHTLEGIMRAATGDWIIRGVKGEVYPCKPDVFIATYEMEPETERAVIEDCIPDTNRALADPTGTGDGK